MSARAPLAGAAAVLAGATAFSWGFVIVKALGLPAPTLALYRLLIGASFLTAIALLLRLPWPRRARPVVAAGVCFGAHQLLFIAATQRTSIAIVTIVAALQPLVVAVTGGPAIGERPTRGTFAWALLALAGVAVVVWGSLSAQSRSLLGDVLSVANLGAFTAFFLLTKRARLQGAHTVTLTASFLAVAAVVVAPALLLVDQAAPAAGWQWGLLALLALGPGNGHLLVSWAHRHTSAALASIVLAAVPLLASIWAYLAFDEPYGIRHVLGGLLVILAVGGARRSEARSARAEGTG